VVPGARARTLGEVQDELVQKGASRWSWATARESARILVREREKRTVRTLHDSDQLSLDDPPAVDPRYSDWPEGY
jgi:hypothetical protein